jgi:sRNA-binding protein
VLALLAAAHPRAFSAERPPLRVGIHKEIEALHPELSRGAVRGALHRWVSHPAYLANLEVLRPRVGLDGVPGEPPTAEAAELAAARRRPGEASQQARGRRPGVIVHAAAAATARVTVPIRADRLPENVAETTAGRAELVLISERVAVRASVSAKSYQRALGAVRAAGGGYVVVQGRLGRGGRLEEVGLAVQPPR